MHNGTEWFLNLVSLVDVVRERSEQKNREENLRPPPGLKLGLVTPKIRSRYEALNVNGVFSSPPFSWRAFLLFSLLASTIPPFNPQSRWVCEEL